MKLFIVESPAKAKTIGQYLGKEFVVIASLGHIRELVRADGSIDVNDNFKMKYQLISKAKSQVNKIVDLAKKSDEIYLASDPDREGEAIAQSLYDVLLQKKVAKPNQFYRVTYNEITKTAIQNALKNTRNIDNNLVDAQQSRQALDYLVGFNLSPVLWRKLPGSRSAGRVQSVALRMVVDREFEIKKFVPEEYWTINCELETNKKEKVECRVIKYNGNTFDTKYPSNEDVTNEVCNFLNTAKEFIVIRNETKDVKQNPYPPFTTSLLQQDAVRKLGFSSKKTMTLAQRLYEGVQINGQTIALITYMRTDGMSLSNDAVAGIRKIIKSDFGEDYLPSNAIFYKTKAKNAQEAHEAIRPTHVEIKPNEIKDQLEYDMWRLYDLIWKRTLACQMNSAIFSRQTIDLEIQKDGTSALSRINGSQLKFNGYLAVYNIKNEHYEEGDVNDDDNLIPTMKVGDRLSIEKTIKQQHFTNPPARFTEASLIKTLESYGIGRPSTYATIISVLQDREYVELIKRQFMPTSRGVVVSVFLKQFFEKYVEYTFTAKLEEDLDLISDGKLGRVDFLKSFWKDFKLNVDNVMDEKKENIFDKMEDIFVKYFIGNDKISTKCPKCENGELILKSSKYGVFFGCNNYPTCTYMKSIDNISNNDGEHTGNSENQKIESSKYGEVVIKNGKYGRYCEFKKDGKPKSVSLPTGELNDDVLEFYLDLPKKLGFDNDGKEVVAGIGRFGPYILCDKRFYSYKKTPFHEITIEDAMEVIEELKNKPKRAFSKTTKNKNTNTTSIKTTENKSYKRKTTNKSVVIKDITKSKSKKKKS